MKVLLKKNVKYKNEPHSMGEKIEIDEDDLEDFQNADAIEEIIGEEGEDVKAKVRIKRDTEEVQEVKETGSTETDLSTSKEDANVIAYEDMTKAQIVEILTEKVIEHNPKDRKEDLIDLLVGSDE